MASAISEDAFDAFDGRGTSVAFLYTRPYKEKIGVHEERLRPMRSNA
jgi:hypothetical protein